MEEQDCRKMKADWCRSENIVYFLFRFLRCCLENPFIYEAMTSNSVMLISISRSVEFERRVRVGSSSVTDVTGKMDKGGKPD